MNRGYQKDDQNVIDYDLWSAPGVNIFIRGPAFDIKPGGYFAAIGAAQTFGRFAPRSYVQEVAQKIHLPGLNLGVSGAGPTFFTEKPLVMDLINGSRFAVVQVMSARSVSNSCFTVQANQGVVAPVWKLADQQTKLAEPAYQEFMANNSVEEVVRLRAEIRLNYIEKMQQLMTAIRVPKVLLYWSTRGTEYEDGINQIGDYWGAFPHFVNRAVVDALKPLATEYLEVITSDGLPQQLWHKDTGERFEVWPADRFPERLRRDVNYYYPSPEMHGRAAEALLPFASKAASEETSGRPYAVPRRGKRNILVHFHIFKNAGTSFDQLLAELFGSGFQPFDPGNEKVSMDERGVVEFVEPRPYLSAVACHQLRPPLSGDFATQLHPIVFLRDPIDRVRSIYAYETMTARRESSTQTHTRKANELGFPGFVEWCLEHPAQAGPISNYQTRICSVFHNGLDPKDWEFWPDEQNLHEALGFFSTLPCVGIVDQFEKSIDAIVENYRHLFPALRNVPYHENRMQSNSGVPFERKHKIIREELGDELFRALVRRNALDLELYRYACQRLNGS